MHGIEKVLFTLQVDSIFIASFVLVSRIPAKECCLFEVCYLSSFKV